ncbi:MAG: helix-hairpin-helix domain-containing protein [Bacteroidota bacterium]|nr:helix-hairpin-helix domain-containing protein [Bacteroidota bacterium]
MSKGWKDFFYLNRGEQRAMLILFAAIILVYGMLIFSRLQPGRPAIDTVAFAKEVRAFEAQIDSSGFYRSDSYKGTNTGNAFNYNRGNEQSRLLTPFPFDPNTLDEKGWLKMGLSGKLTGIILHYRAKGGRFWQKEDLQKIYGLSPSQYKALEPFIVIPQKPQSAFGTSPFKNIQPYRPPVETVELNSVDSAGLDALRGIGPVFAKRILRFRDLLGGYAAREQLLEVYGLDSTLYQVILPYVKVDPDLVKRMDINQCSLATLKKHPYISYYLAKAIADYRVKHLRFRSVDEVRLLPGMTPEKFSQLSPYLIVLE